VWPLESSDWRTDDLERLAELLGGSRIGADAGSLVPLDAGELRRLWDELRGRQAVATGPPLGDRRREARRIQDKQLVQ